MSMFDLQRYPNSFLTWFCFFNLFSFISGFSAKVTCAFLLIRSNGELMSFKHFSSQKNDSICHLFNQIQVLKVTVVNQLSHLNRDGVKIFFTGRLKTYSSSQFFPVKTNLMLKSSFIILIAALKYNISISRLKQQLSNMDWSELPRGNPVLLEAVQVNSLIFLILRKYCFAIF